eukprot:Opistho-2@2397
MATKDATVDRESVQSAYDDVRNDNSATSWAVFTYSSTNNISTAATGSDYEELLTYLKDDERVYAFVRIETGDELSKRAKFAFIAWIGDGVNPLRKAKVSTDKAFVKQIVQSFACEILASDKNELKFADVKAKVVKAGGANYGTGR